MLSIINRNRCFDRATDVSNDFVLLMNVQSCFHDAETFEIRNSNRIATILFVCVLIVIGFILGFEYLKASESKFYQIKKDFEIISEFRNQLRKQLDSISLEVQEVKNIINNYKIVEDIEILKRTSSKLSYSLKKINNYLFAGHNIALVAPSSSKFHSKKHDQYSSFRSANRISLFNSESGGTTSSMAVSSEINLIINETPPSDVNITPSPLDSSKIILQKFKPFNVNPEVELIKSSFKESILKAINSKEKKEKQEEAEKTEEDDRDEVITNMTLNLPEPEIRYKDINKSSKSGKKFKRLLVPGRGWVAAKVFEMEESQFGANAIIMKS